MTLCRRHTAGAMENKGLNIFNSRLVLASPESATDADYQRIEAVVAHGVSSPVNKCCCLGIFFPCRVISSLAMMESTVSHWPCATVPTFCVSFPEYFHNWTGNRVTCRDWFQLTLKEGLTVFRDHEVS